MGIFDWPAPLAHVIDSAFASFAGGSLRIALWALLASALSMGLYRLTSNQKKLAALKGEIAALKAKINAAETDDYAAAVASSKALLSLSLRHVGQTLGPTVLAGLPVLFVLAFLAQTYSYVAPEAGIPLTAAIAYEDGHTETTTLTFPVNDPRFEADIATGNAPASPVPVIAKPSWTDWFFGNPAGTLKPASAIREISFKVTPQRFLPFGPDWLAGWEALFLTLMVVASLAIKAIFRIE